MVSDSVGQHISTWGRDMDKEGIYSPGKSVPVSTTVTCRCGASHTYPGFPSMAVEEKAGWIVENSTGTRLCKGCGATERVRQQWLAQLLSSFSPAIPLPVLPVNGIAGGDIHHNVGDVLKDKGLRAEILVRRTDGQPVTAEDLSAAEECINSFGERDYSPRDELRSLY